jgi:hypothetical protein
VFPQAILSVTPELMDAQATSVAVLWASFASTARALPHPVRPRKLMQTSQLTCACATEE